MSPESSRNAARNAARLAAWDGKEPDRGIVYLRRLLQTQEKIYMTLLEIRRGQRTWHAGEPISVMPLPRGRFLVIDGNHRVVEAILDGKVSSLPALIGFKQGMPTNLVSIVETLAKPETWQFGARRGVTLPGPRELMRP